MNIADIMTRPERFHELMEGLLRTAWYAAANPEGPRKYALKMPPLGDSWESLPAWARRMQGVAAEAVLVAK